MMNPVVPASPGGNAPKVSVSLQIPSPVGSQKGSIVGPPGGKPSFMGPQTSLQPRSSMNPGDQDIRQSQCGEMRVSGNMRHTTTGEGKKKSDTATKIRAQLTASRWYRSRFASGMRSALQNKYFAAMMIVALLAALYLPDIWLLLGMNSNTELDIILLIVMILFAIEVTLLSTVDASYFLSFFFMMDIIGTLSMVSDISFMWGTDHTVPFLQTSDGEAKRQFMLLRATRAAKVGARAGRLTRVLRVLRFLPFLAGAREPDKDKQGIASVISSQLANLLATRVACLTILLVMVIPLFDLWQFPTADYSLKAWCGRLSSNLRKGYVNETLDELKLMVTFYDRYPHYGPFKACVGTPTDDDTLFKCEACNPGRPGCQEIESGWQPVLQSPSRGASAYIVHTEDFMLAFNMQQPIALGAGLSMATISFIIFIMIFSGLALSSVIMEIAVRPLERMLATVRHIAATVFKFKAAEKEDETAPEDVDIDSSSEMKLLEKVVQKLAVIAELQTKDNLQTNEEMGDEDLGIMGMMKGTDVVQERAKHIQDRRSMAMPRKKVSPTMRPEDCGLTKEVYDSYSLNALTLSKNQKSLLAAFAVSTAPFSVPFMSQSQDDQSLLSKFITAAESEYLSNPFHNFSHAIDVLHTACRMMRLMGSENFLTDLDQYALIIAAVGHDLGHPGVNNGFLSEVGHELALQYNDKSPLENMHCAKLYTIVGNQETNVFSRLSKDQYKDARKLCIDTILHTDMLEHNVMVKDLQMTYQMNCEILQNPTFTQMDSEDNSPSMAEIEVYSNPDMKSLILQAILHTADVSNPCKVWEATHAWAMACLEEFFAQGDQEKMLGIPVQFLNDRDKLNKPNSQIGFVEFMIAPLICSVCRLWPPLRELGDNLSINIGAWEEMWIKEVSPGEEEKTKVAGRVARVKKNLEDASNRIPIAS